VSVFLRLPLASRCPETFFAKPCEERFMSKPTPLFEPPTGSVLYPRYHADPHAIPSRIAAALQAMRDGRPVVLQDDFNRENEADLVIAAEKLTIETMALLIRECSGIVCLCLPDTKIRQLALPQMVPANQSRHGTAFTVSIEARDGVSTGVSAADRLTTIRAAIADQAKPTDIVRPGHVFPLRAQPGGVLARRGHTEGTIDLCWLAGLKPAGVLCELMNPDGTMMRGDDVERFATQHRLPMLTIEELVDFRRALERPGTDASIPMSAALSSSAC
jgi:3,4-dihydroxy 2-butanone 4-phosphate synthase